jgi:primosomal protein N' (replication factor Y) (superfamily II helicase)
MQRLAFLFIFRIQIFVVSVTTLFADVIVPLAVPNLFTYRIPSEWNELAIAGKRVIVQFGKTKFYTGIIRSVHEKPPKAYEAKYVESIFDDEPVVNELQLKMWDWICYYYMAYPGDVLSAALPSGLRLNSETKIVLSQFFDEQQTETLSEKEKLITESLRETGPISIQQLSDVIEVKNVQPLLKQLVKKKFIQVYEEVRQKFKPKRVQYVRLHTDLVNSEERLKEVISILEKKAFRQLEAVLAYIASTKKYQNDLPVASDFSSWMEKSELVKKTDGAAVNALVKKGIFEELETEKSRLEQSGVSGKLKELNSAQLNALTKIKNSFLEKTVCLLHGVTGSGKTEVYFHLIDEVLKEGKQVLFLVPEIALTTQLIHRIRHCFGDRAGIYHSKFSENERVEIWNGVLKNQLGKTLTNEPAYDLVIGARSSVFLPFQNLGLIIVDEEHDGSFKQQDPSPRYNARDLAIYLAGLHQAKVVLGTATPSVETYYLAREGKFGLVNLHHRFGEAQLPESVLCNMQHEYEKGKPPGVFSRLLLEEISLRLEKKEQVILFQNRRGFAPVTECQICAWVPQCLQCDVSLIYHKHSGKLNCHYCGYTVSPPSSCGACGSADLRHKNFGTERVEEELQLIFPDARIARMDLDTTRSKSSYAQLISEFEEGKIDVLVGTQMVTKGLDFDRVSLVGVLQADQMLNFPDFRSFERGFQLLTQVSGRAGRKDIPGKVVIQTRRPEHPVFQFVLETNYTEFFIQQINERKEFHYPPFYRLIEFEFVDKNLDLVNNGAAIFSQHLREQFGSSVLGPEFPAIARIRNNYHKKTLLKTERNASHLEIRKKIHGILEEFRSVDTFKRLRVLINVDPY